MASMNKVLILGNLGKDPEIRSFSNGGKVANLSVATSEFWKDKNTGEQRERTEWHKVAIFSEYLVGVCEKSLRKGSKVLVEGKLQTRKYQDSSGQDRYVTEVVVQGYDGKLTLLDPRTSRSPDQDYPDYGGQSSTPRGAREVEEDDLPF